MKCDLARVSRFLEVPPVTDDRKPGLIKFRLRRDTGHLIVGIEGIDNPRSLVQIGAYDLTDRPLFNSTFACDEIVIDDSPPPRILVPNLAFHLAAASADFALFSIGKPPDYVVHIYYMDLMDLKNTQTGASPGPPPRVSDSEAHD